MKKLAYLFILGVMIVGCKGQDINIMSYNIRLNTPNDGENAWPNRANNLTDQIQSVDASIIGVQEALPDQMLDLERLMPEYEHIGVGRDENSSGEYSAIFYDSGLFEVMTSNTFWLSKTPSVVSKDWDAALPRICTYGLFKHRKTGNSFWVFNTHFDHVGSTSRVESAKLILSKIQEVNTNNLPVVLMGDLNVEPGDPVIKVFEKQLRDAISVIDDPVGSFATFNGFNLNQDPTRRIDYIFISKNIEQNVHDYQVLRDLKNNRYISDHFPVIVTLRLR